MPIAIACSVVLLFFTRIELEKHRNKSCQNKVDTHKKLKRKATYQCTSKQATTTVVRGPASAHVCCKTN